MSNLSILKTLEKSGVKTKFLVFTPYIKLFPINFEEAFEYQQNNKVIKKLNISIQFYLDIENIFTLSICLTQPNIYINNKNKKPYISLTSEPIYEYGYEEHYLPNINNIQLIKNEEEFYLKIKEQLLKHHFFHNQYFLDKIIDLIYNKINKKNNIPHNYYYNKDSIYKLKEYFKLTK